MIPYYEFDPVDSTNIHAEMYDDVSEIRFLNDDNLVPEHRHRFFELVYIQRGSCRHFYKDYSTILIPGDLFMISPNEPHSYQFDNTIQIYNCQFYPGMLDSDIVRLIRGITSSNMRATHPIHNRLQDIHDLWEDTDDNMTGREKSANINAQGILHTNTQQQSIILTDLNAIIYEQKNQGFEFSRLKKMHLESMLIHINRIKMEQFHSSEQITTWQTEMIQSAMNEIDLNPSISFDFKKEAARQHLSYGYYRNVFKKVTGLSPIDYLNRVRIIKSLELLQTTSMSVSEVAGEIGILDPNYFSRLFKKFLGCSPRNYKAII